jgi:hypothetical protein
MADDLFGILDEISDAMGVAGAPIKGVRVWMRRDEGRNLLRELQREVDKRWRDQPTRSDVYNQIARHLQKPELWVPFSAVVEGDADALEEVRAYLRAHLGTESQHGSEEVAEVVAEVLANYLGRAQTSPEAATDVVGRLRHEQGQQRFDAMDDRLDLLQTGQARIFEQLREGRVVERGQSNLAEALVLGPLNRIDAVDDVRAAERADAEGDPAHAADMLLSVAERLEDARLDLAAESVRERAGELLARAGQRPKAAAVLLEVARRRVARGTRLASTTIRTLRDALDPIEGWIADALEAVADWPGRGDPPVQTLREAARRAAGRKDELWFVAAAVDLLSLYGRQAEVLEVTALVVGRPLAGGERLAIELDRLEALEATGAAADVEQQWLALLRWADTQGSAQSAGLAWQRRGAVLAGREEVDAAHDAYRRAMGAWATVEGFEEQAGDAFFSMQTVSTINAKPIPELELRPLAYALRGRADTPAARVDRMLSEGMQDRLRPRGEPAALRAFWHAVALARRSGSLVRTMIAVERLAELHAHAREPYIALAFYLTAGNGKQAAELAQALHARNVGDVLTPGGPRWYRAAVYAVVAGIGRLLPEDVAQRLAGHVLAESREEPDSWIAPQPALAAKRALAAMALALPDQLANGAFEQVVGGLSHAQYDIAKASAGALILATNVAAYDATDELLELFARDPYNYGISVAWVAERLEAAPTKASILRAAALEGKDPVLAALVLADLAQDDELQARCDEAGRRWTEFEPTKESVADGVQQASTGLGTSVDIAGIVGRRASPGTRVGLVERLLDVAADTRHPEDTRASAAGAIRNLAPALAAAQATTAAARLLPLARGEYELSRWDANIDHPLSPFQVRLHEAGILRAAAVAAVARLAAEHDVGLDELPSIVQSAVGADEPSVVAAAFEALRLVETVDCPVPLEVAMRHPEADVRQAALAAHLERERSVPKSPTLTALVNDPVVSVRLTLAKGMRGMPDAEPVLSMLADDPDAYVRAVARRAREDAPAEQRSATHC